MARRHSVMKESLKEEIARELGVYDEVKANGWGGVSSRNCGNMVTKAIELAQKNMS